MARSSYIYIVLDSWGQVDAAFTVKHEMQTYLERGYGPEKCKAIRIRDGGKGELTELDMEDLIKS